MKIVVGEGKKSEILGGPEGCPAEGGPAEGGSSGRGGGGSSGGFRVQGSGSGFMFLGTNRNRTKKMKSKMRKKRKKKKQKKVKERQKQKEKRKKEKKRNRANTICSTSANFGFGQLAEVELSEVELAEVEHPRRKDLNSPELEIVNVFERPTTGVAANGEVQTKAEATLYVKELYLILTVMMLEDTPAVLSLGKLREDQGYSYHWTSGQKQQLIKNGRRIQCNTANYVPFFVPDYRQALQAHLHLHLLHLHRRKP